MIPLQKKFISLSSASIAYSTFGLPQNPAVIFIHGFPMTSEMWKFQIEELQKKFFVITYDLRGFGQSTSEHEYYTMETMADDLIELVEQLQIKKTTVVGFSMGGYVALRAVLKNPNSFAKLVLIDTQSAADGNEAKIKRYQAMEKLQIHGIKIFTQDFIKGTLDPKNVEKNPQFLVDLSQIAQTNVAKGLLSGLVVMLSRMDTTESLSKINLPTLIVVGENDQVTPVLVAQKLRDGIPNSELKVIGNAGHFSPYENFKDVNVELSEFIFAK